MGILSKSLTLMLILTAASVNALSMFDAPTISTSPGSQVWSKTFGGIGDEWAFSVIQTSDGGYAMAGYTNSSGAGYEDVWLIRLTLVETNCGIKPTEEPLTMRLILSFRLKMTDTH